MLFRHMVLQNAAKELSNVMPCWKQFTSQTWNQEKEIAYGIGFPDPIHDYLWICLQPWTTMYQIYKVLFQCFDPLSIWENDAKMCMILCFILNKHPCLMCFFVFSNFYQIYLHDENYVALENELWSINNIILKIVPPLN
jgi:hypothetical protein